MVIITAAATRVNSSSIIGIIISGSYNPLVSRPVLTSYLILIKEVFIENIRDALVIIIKAISRLRPLLSLIGFLSHIFLLLSLKSLNNLLLSYFRRHSAILLLLPLFNK